MINEGLDTKITTLNQKLDQAQEISKNELKKQSKGVDALDLQVKRLDTKVDGLDDQVKELNSNVIRIQDDMEFIKSSLTQLLQNQNQ
ncbi:UNKNOWN [Stylonychia lemnae]|uniref:Uncharacterized protein n=1 Tax=Stylonychia lemnae TaxID=5949 RepID=A0A078ANM8_STYLE|nr:UNKNOWN [Stylonychia lemnae]|eukprot:CDW82907.1 UNKNOWN [Stylonychia lemnae]